MGHEHLENLIGGAFARKDVGVLASVINLGDVVKLHEAVLVHIQLVVGSPDPVGSCFVEVTLQTQLEKIAVTYLQEAEELIEINSAAVVSVKFLQDLSGFFFAELEAVVDEAPSEVIDVQLAVAVVVHGLEDSGDALDASSRSFEDFGFDFSNEVVYGEFLEFFNVLGV